MKKKSFAGSGLQHNDITRDISGASVNRTRRNTMACDAWREAKLKDPSIVFRISFVEFKKKFLSKIRNPVRSPRK